MTLTPQVMGAVENMVPRIREVLLQNKMGYCLVDSELSTPGACQVKGKGSRETVRYWKPLDLAAA